MDLMLPVNNGITANALIKSKWPNVSIMALTNLKEKEMVEDAIIAGSMSYFLKNVSAGELVTAIRGAMQGQPRL